MPNQGSRDAADGRQQGLTTWAIVVAALAATVTNRLPLSLLGFAWLLGVGLLGLLSQPQRLPRLSLCCLAYLGLSLLSVLLYAPSSLWTLGFYRYDGNLLITYAPLVVLAWLPLLPWSSSGVQRAFVRWACSVSLLAMAGLRLAGQDEWFKALFNSTNGFGGFMMVVACLALGWLLSDRRAPAEPIAWLLLGFGLIAASSSRGSLLGLLLSAALAPLLLALGPRPFKAALLALVVLITSLQLVLISPAVQTYGDGAHTAAIAEAGAEDNDTKGANILIRLYENWPRGLYLFLKSPMVGTGFGSANDYPFVFEQDGPALVQANQSGEPSFNDAHAHHTYFHILGEQGLLGLAVFLLFWAELLNTLLRSRGAPETRLGLILAWVALTLASFTEHRIPSPSNAFPFVLLLCLYWMAADAAAQLPADPPPAHRHRRGGRSPAAGPEQPAPSAGARRTR